MSPWDHQTWMIGVCRPGLRMNPWCHPTWKIRICRPGPRMSPWGHPTWMIGVCRPGPRMNHQPRWLDPKFLLRQDEYVRRRECWILGCLSHRRRLSCAANICGAGGQVRHGKSVDDCCIPCQSATSLPRNTVQAVRTQFGARNRAWRFLDCWNVVQLLVACGATSTPFARQPCSLFASTTRVRFAQGESKS